MATVFLQDSRMDWNMFRSSCKTGTGIDSILSSVSHLGGEKRPISHDVRKLRQHPDRRRCGWS